MIRCIALDCDPKALIDQEKDELKVGIDIRNNEFPTPTTLCLEPAK